MKKIVDCRREVIPVIEVIIKKHFPVTVEVEESVLTDGIDSNALDDLTDYYFDNSSVDDLKVFLWSHRKKLLLLN